MVRMVRLSSVQRHGGVVFCVGRPTCECEWPLTHWKNLTSFKIVGRQFLNSEDRGQKNTHGLGKPVACCCTTPYTFILSRRRLHQHLHLHYAQQTPSYALNSKRSGLAAERHTAVPFSASISSTTSHTSIAISSYHVTSIDIARNHGGCTHDSDSHSGLPNPASLRCQCTSSASHRQRNMGSSFQRT